MEADRAQIDAIKRNRAALEHQLGEITEREGKKWRCFIPEHDDEDPSIRIYEGNNGWRCKCFGCGFDGTVFDARSVRPIVPLPPRLGPTRSRILCSRVSPPMT